ncbi:hypothetical protein BC937DRAFT_91929 [Endogone sp. FLAS-F59071]|nr:hypothetical protein BC937DRAFT_91929 [Endogone sp. FLAS-F59071]|eukprot:RUS21657.1 hypothetical protein BC937DRAFT_91929 [Endogone sp. FLAS-F59071]
MEIPQLGTNCAQLSCNQLGILYRFAHCNLAALLVLTFRLILHLQETSSPSSAGFASKPFDHQCERWEQANKQLQKCPTCSSLIFIPEHLGTETISPKETLDLHLASGCQNYVFSPSTKIEPVRCHIVGCGDVEKYVGGVKCEGCRETFCLKFELNLIFHSSHFSDASSRHRSPLVHSCTSLDLLEEKKQRRRQAAQEVLDKNFFKKTGADEAKVKPVAAPRPIKKGSRTVEVMKMKAKAQGDASIPQASRLYLRVHYPAEAGLESKTIFLDKTWTVGKALDKIANTGRIQNMNNRVTDSDGERLHLYKLSDISNTEPDAIRLANDQRLETVLESADEILMERWKVRAG